MTEKEAVGTKKKQMKKTTGRRRSGTLEKIVSKGGYDMNIMFPVLFLVGVGMVMVYSASSAVAVKKFGSDFFFLRKQALFAVAGIMALVFCRHFPFKVYKPFTYFFLVFSMVLLAVTHLPGIGHSAGGASRWIRIDSFTFQPSELARLALIFYLAYSLCRKQEKIREFSIGFVPHIIVLTVFGALLVSQPDFGTVLIFCAIAWIMMFVARVRIVHLAIPLAMIVPDRKSVV